VWVGNRDKLMGISLLRTKTGEHLIQERCAIANITARFALYMKIVSRCGDMAI